MDPPPSLAREISPPLPWKKRKLAGVASTGIVDATRDVISGQLINPRQDVEPTLAAIEAGKAKIDDHLAYFRDRLSKASRQTGSYVARLPIEEFAALYNSSNHDHGNHFVVHQHNHPRAGVHYDLRLQFSKSSSISFALPKGLPGNPNSKSIGRMAIETRVHNYWNHLIESASSKTGSLLIWDTGTYEVLPRKTAGSTKKGIPSPQTTDNESESSSQEDSTTTNSKPGASAPENEKLIAAFQSRYIRLRLHGTRLPSAYTVILRLPSNEIIKRPTKRRRGKKARPSGQHADSEPDEQQPPQQVVRDDDEDLDTDTDEDAQTRATNAYPGSHNSIGSVHQRHWFLQLDRQNSGFVLDRADSVGGKGTWRGGFEQFVVRGRDVERSVVTGRLAREVECDEGVEGYVGRGGWVGVE